MHTYRHTYTHTYFIATPSKGFSVTRLNKYHTKITKNNQITKVINTRDTAKLSV